MEYLLSASCSSPNLAALVFQGISSPLQQTSWTAHRWWNLSLSSLISFFSTTSIISVYLNEVPVFLHFLAIIGRLFVRSWWCPRTTVCLLCVYKRALSSCPGEDVPYLADACILGYYASSVFFSPTGANWVTKEILLAGKTTNWTKRRKEDASANL